MEMIRCVVAVVAVLAATEGLAQSASPLLAPSGADPAAAPMAGAAPSSQSPSAPGTVSSNRTVAPSGQTVQAGVLELTPKPIALRYERGRNFNNGETCILGNLRFHIVNAGASDVRVYLAGKVLRITDDLGLPILEDPEIMGLSVFTGHLNDLARVDKSQMTVLSPNQPLEVQVNKSRKGRCNEDRDGEIYRSHRPLSATVTGSLIVVDANGQGELRPFSFSDVPVQVRAQ